MRFKLTRKQTILCLIILVSCLVTITGVYIAYYVKSKIDNMIIPDPSTIDATDEDRAQKDRAGKEDRRSNQKGAESFYVLVIGLDYRPGHQSMLTDSLVVMHVVPMESMIKLLSIPRDLLVENSEGYNVKINSLFYEGYERTRRQAQKDPSILTGEETPFGSRTIDKAILRGAMSNTRDHIEKLLDIHIDYMILVNFETLKLLVDEVGGIEIDVKRSMRYKETNLYLEPGVQILYGEDALGYARFRLDDRGPRYYISDFERGKNQQEVIKALAAKMLSWQSSTRALKLLEIVSDNIKTDLTYSDMYTLIKNYYNAFDADSFVSIPFPEHYSQEGEVIIPDDALQQLREDFQHPDWE